MNDTQLLLRNVGISAAVISALLLTGLGFLAYKNFYELQRTKLEILRLQKELGLPMDNNIIEGYIKDHVKKII